VPTTFEISGAKVTRLFLLILFTVGAEVVALVERVPEKNVPITFEISGAKVTRHFLFIVFAFAAVGEVELFERHIISIVGVSPSKLWSLELSFVLTVRN
jgi:hypothetical protein